MTHYDKETLNKAVVVNYTNWRGETSDRVIIPGKLFKGKTEYHPEPCWLLECHDVQKNALRTYAVKDIHQWHESEFKVMEVLGI